MTPAPQRALLLSGSPRRKGASAMLGAYLSARLTDLGLDVRRIHLTGLLETEEGRAKLAKDAAWAQLLVLCSPVYVDAPPAPVMRALEFLADSAGGEPAGRTFAALFTCGFPETAHTRISLDICELFARRSGFAWGGGLGVGGGSALYGKTLEARGNMTRSLRASLDQAALALARGQVVPASAVAQAAKPLMPRLLYVLMATWGMVDNARKRRKFLQLWKKPFAKP